MTETDSMESGSHAADQSLTFQIAARLDNLAMIRTVVGAAATFEDIDIDTVADLKLATDEACTRLIRASVSEATLTVRLDFHSDRLGIVASAQCLPGDVFPIDSFSWHVLRSLVDHIEVFERDRSADETGRTVGVTMSTGRRTAAAVHVAHG
ncbi:ATP-binding protein [Mycobacteroides chelonae]|uniref:ATP-binding protein n=1 Tax=Mycobacteroides chelonae TaxID=1774 RepID=UPI000918BF4D|nr:ATP-binding protein [Mycobacteroides chelonae]AYM44688.1 ATP-binding protein [[Mycobacterium] chelonae subsp. gwanakae]OHU17290.1 anti-sigma factor [Mycobacteroides chelonae]